MSDSNKPDLDLIRMVQQARMAHDADAKPSQVAAVYWIEVKPCTASTLSSPFFCAVPSRC